MSEPEAKDEEGGWRGLVKDLVNEQAVTGASLLGVLRLLVEKRVLLNPEAMLVGGEGEAPRRRAQAAPKRMAGRTRRPRKRSEEELGALLESAPASPLIPALDRIAAIVCETYAEAGDDAVFPDDEALLLIRDILLDEDKQIIERNRGRNTAAWARSWDRLLPRDSRPSPHADGSNQTTPNESSR